MSTLGIDVRPARAHFTLQMGDTVLYEAVPANIAVTDDGIVVGEAAVAAGGQAVLPVDWTASDEGPDPEQLPLATFLERTLDRLKDTWELDSREEVLARDVTAADVPDADEQRETDTEAHTETATDTGTDPDDDPMTDTGRAAPFPVDRTVVAVPGGFGHSEIATVKQAVRAAGLPVETVLRRPASIALSDLSFDVEQTVMILDVDTEWCNVGVVTTSPGGALHIDARLGRPGMGRREWLGAIAEAVIERAGRAHDAVVEYNQRAVDTVMDALEELLTPGDDPADLYPLAVDLELEEGAELVLADRMLSETVSVDVTVDEALVYAALETYTDGLQDALTTTLTAAGIDRDTVDDVVLTGSGTRLHVFEEFLSGYFETAVRRLDATDGREGSLRPPALAAPSAGPSVATETVDGFVEVGAGGTEGLETRLFSDALVAHNASLQAKLRTREPTQSVGRFELVFRHPLTGEVLDRRRFTVTRLPPGEDAVRTLIVGVTFDQPTLTADAEIDITVTVDGEERSVTSGDTENAPWLLHPDVEPSAVSAIGDPHADDLSFARTVEPTTPFVDAAGKETVAEVVHEMRTDLWDWGIKQERALEPDNAEVVLNGLEKRLDRHGIGFFEPNLGGTPDPDRHHVRESRESEADEGVIVEVLKPGLEVEGRVVEKSVVAIVD